MRCGPRTPAASTSTSRSARDAAAFFGAGDLARLRAVKAEVDPEGMILANHPV